MVIIDRIRLATGFASIVLATGCARDIDEKKLIASPPIYDSINPFGQLQFANYTPKKLSNCISLLFLLSKFQIGPKQISATFLCVCVCVSALI